MITYQTTKAISDVSLRPLYQVVEWYAYTNHFSDLSVLLEQTVQVISAWDNQKLVGLVRTIGDGVYVELIQDLLVLPDYQKQGIGKTLLSMALEGATDKKQCFLITDSTTYNQGTLAFYNKCVMLEPFDEMNITGFYRK